MRKQILIIFALAALLLASNGTIHATTIDFESFSSGDTPFALGITFTDAVVVTAGISLNEFEFPPHSGSNAIFDCGALDLNNDCVSYGGTMILTFGTPVTAVSAFFTYTTQLTLTAFDALNTTVDSMMSAFTENFVSSGNPPNEPLGIAFAGGIARVTIAGDPAGGSFALDDLTFTPIPEPSTLILFGIGIASILGCRRIQRHIVGHRYES